MKLRPNSTSDGESDLATAIAAYAAGDESAADWLFTALRAPTLAEAKQFLQPDSIDLDDVVQETLLAVLNYLKKNGGFSGDLIRFSITVVRNRCRNILSTRKRRRQLPVETLKDRLTSALLGNPLEALLEKETRQLIQHSLDELDPPCRQLLHTLYVRGKRCKEMMEPLGLKSVHGVYRRRSVCLAKLNRIVKKRLAICSPLKGRGRERS